MARKGERYRRPARVPSRRSIKKRLLVVCEGEVTEKQYIIGFVRWRRNARCEVVTIGTGNDPRALINRAKNERDKAMKQARSDDDENPQYDEIWCVFDRDQHSHFDAACVTARDNSFNLAVSNPCIELWLLLHFRDSPGIRERGDVQQLLRKHLPEYSKHVHFDDYKLGYDDARLRASRLDAQADLDGEPMRNPTTGFFRLSESIEST